MLIVKSQSFNVASRNLSSPATKSQDMARTGVAQQEFSVSLTGDQLLLASHDRRLF